MANELKVAMQQSILTLHEAGRSQRQIARLLGIDRETVARHIRLRQAGSKPAIPTAGSSPPAESDPAIPTAGSGLPGEPKPAIPTAGSSGRRSQCEPLRERIQAGLESGLSAQRIWQDLAAESGFTGSYESVKRFARRLESSHGLPFRRMECGPGEEAQVDFGRGAAVIDPEGRRRCPSLFRIVLSHSRKGYSEAVWRQTTETFIRVLENAFRHFGGVPHTLVIDNLRAAVSRADWYEPDVHPKLRDFCRHYGTAVLPTRP
mgnify:CR=1 FL=1